MSDPAYPDDFNNLLAATKDEDGGRRNYLTCVDVMAKASSRVQRSEGKRSETERAKWTGRTEKLKIRVIFGRLLTMLEETGRRWMLRQAPRCSAA